MVARKPQRAPGWATPFAADVSGLPVLPATACGGADEEAQRPEDQPDDEQDPQDVKRRCQKTAPTEEQQQQDQDDQRNQLLRERPVRPPFISWRQPRASISTPYLRAAVRIRRQAASR